LATFAPFPVGNAAHLRHREPSEAIETWATASRLSLDGVASLAMTGEFRGDERKRRIRFQKIRIYATVKIRFAGADRRRIAAPDREAAPSRPEKSLEIKKSLLDPS